MQNLFDKKFSALSAYMGVMLLLTICFNASGQTPPGTEIFLVDLKLNGQSVEVGNPVNITSRAGYDNQPSFTPDGRGLLYTSNQGGSQTDIYRFDLLQKTTSQLTSTPESEYSPILTPDQAFFSVIRVEKDNTQRLWKFPLSATGEPKLILENVKPVGYHCWLNADSLALFILGQPNFLQLARVSTGDTTRIEGSIGRSIHKIPGKSAVSFIHKRGPADWVIKQLDLRTKQISEIAKTLEGSEDFVWMPNGTMLMCQGTALFQLKPNDARGWIQLADFASSGVKQLTRLAIDPQSKMLAMVGQE